MKKKSFTVAVTGFGPYREYAHNTSSTVRNELPTQIKRANTPSIEILKYPHDIRCIYSEVLSLVPELWSGQRSVYEPGSSSGKAVEIDLMIHIGMHPDTDVYFIEKRARREKYVHVDEDGKVLNSDVLKGRPRELVVGFDVDDIAEEVRESLPDDITVKASNDAGLYFCELISYLSLDTLEQRKEFRRVVFLHVPPQKTEESIERGVKVAMALIEACVDSLPSDYRKSS